MRIAYLLMLVLGISLLLGCAAKKPAGNDSVMPPANKTPAPAETNGAIPPKNTSDTDLADLFNMDTSKPISDEGLKTETPAGEGNSSN